MAIRWSVSPFRPSVCPHFLSVRNYISVPIGQIWFILGTNDKYGKCCISSYSKKWLFFSVYELIKIIFLENGTVRTNKMKFWRTIKRGQNMWQLPKREEFLFILLVSSQIECLISIFNKTNILNSMVNIENKQPNHLLCCTCFTYNVRYTRLLFMVKLVLLTSRTQHWTGQGWQLFWLES